MSCRKTAWNSLPRGLSVGQCATAACLYEVAAPKPGNVHRGADFDDLTFEDFVTAAVVVGPIFDRLSQRSPIDQHTTRENTTGEARGRDARVGEVIRDAVKTSVAATGTNVNLGIVLLLAPLAAVPRDQTLSAGIEDVLASLDADDARFVYDAIRVAQPGGMGRVEQDDIDDKAPSNLLAAMRSASERDMIARQYVDGFRPVLESITPWLIEELHGAPRVADAMIATQMRVMAEFPDSLIARKCGRETADAAAGRAGRVLEARRGGMDDYHEALADFDFWLRSDGHRRNPGTTADLLAAAMFCVLRDLQ